MVPKKPLYIEYDKALPDFIIGIKKRGSFEPYIVIEVLGFTDQDYLDKKKEKKKLYQKMGEHYLEFDAAIAESKKSWEDNLLTLNQQILKLAEIQWLDRNEDPPKSTKQNERPKTESGRERYSEPEPKPTPMPEPLPKTEPQPPKKPIRPELEQKPFEPTKRQTQLEQQFFDESKKYDLVNQLVITFIVIALLIFIAYILFGRYI